MKGKLPEYQRGWNSADSWLDSCDRATARRWLDVRQAQTHREPLSAEYVRGFTARLSQ